MSKSHTPMQMKSSQDFEYISRQIKGKETYPVSLIRKKYNDGVWVRQVRANRLTSAKEAYASRIFRLLTNKYQPKYNMVESIDEPKRSVSISQAVSGFVEVGVVSDFLKEMVSPRELIDAKLGQLYAAAGIVEDGDCHAFNFAFDGEGHLVKIDFDNAFDFPSDLPTQDLIQHLLEFKKYSWTGWRPSLKKEAPQDSTYRQDVLYTLLFFCLLNSSTFQQMALDVWPTEEQADAYANQMECKRIEMRSHLMRNAEFKHFLEQHGNQAIAAITERIKEVNDESEKRIEKFNRRIALFNEHKANFQLLAEYKYLIQKERYKNLNHAEIIQMFRERIQAYQRKIISINRVRANYSVLLEELKLTTTSAPSANPFCATAKDQKQLANLKKQYDADHPMGQFAVLKELLQASPEDEKAIIFSANRLVELVSAFSKEDKERIQYSVTFTSNLIETAISASRGSETAVKAAIKLALCVIELRDRVYIPNGSEAKKNAFVNLLLKAAKETQSPKPLRAALRLVDFPDEEFMPVIREQGLAHLLEKTASSPVESRPLEDKDKSVEPRKIVTPNEAPNTKAEQKKVATVEDIEQLINSLLDFTKPEVSAFWYAQVWFSALKGGVNIGGHLMPRCISRLYNASLCPLDKKNDETILTKFKKLGSTGAAEKSYLSCFFSSPILRTNATHGFVTALSKINVSSPANVGDSYEMIYQWKVKVFDRAPEVIPINAAPTHSMGQSRK
jgi:hypothetical protein